MTETATPSNAVTPAADGAPLEWVSGEIRGSLAEAARLVKTFLGSKNDPAPLRAAREHLHQVNGALHLLDLRGVTLVTEAAERLLAFWESAPRECLPSAVRAFDATLTAIRNYLDGLIAGRNDPPIRLYPYYRELLVLLGAPRIHPADLLFPDLGRHPPVGSIPLRLLTTDELRVRRIRYEEGLLRFLRDPENNLARSQMRDAVAELEGMPQRRTSRTFWWVVRGLLDALEVSGLPVDDDAKRLLARIDQQLRRQLQGGFAIAERLMIDALYHVARSDRRVARIGEIRRLFGLDTLVPDNFERASLTTIDTETLQELKDAIGQCKALWSQTGSGPSVRAPAAGGARADAAESRLEDGQMRELGRAAQAAHRLGAEAAAGLIECIAGAAPRMRALAEPAREAVAMEIATALLLLEVGIDTYPQSDPQFELRAAAMIGRIESAAQGMALAPAEPWLTELARRAQERASLDTVIAEMRGMLREAELRLDAFFRNPAQREPLADLDSSFDQVAGVFGVLGHDAAVAALQDIGAAVCRFRDLSTAADPQEFARIAQNLGAIGFFIDTLAQNPTESRAMFRYDPETGMLHADIAVARDVPGASGPDADDEEDAADVGRGPADAAARSAIDVSPDTAGDSADGPAGDAGGGATEASEWADDEEESSGEWLAAGREKPVVPAPSAPLPESASAVDEELFEIFLSEAEEELRAIAEQLGRLRRDPADRDALTMARRAFHTLKGSSRMVGLQDFGEFAWALEQCFNVWLAQETAATDPLIDLAAASAESLRAWVDALRRDPRATSDVSAWVAAADAVRAGGPFEAPESARTVRAEPAAEAPAPAQDPAKAPPPPPEPEEDVLQIGPVTVSRGLYSIFLQESDECIRALEAAIAEWRAGALAGPHSDGTGDFESVVRRAHTLAGIAGTVGLDPVCELAEPIDATLQWILARHESGAASFVPTEAQFDTLAHGIRQLQTMLHQFAAGIHPDPAHAEAAALHTLLALVRETPPTAAPAESRAAPPSPSVEPPPALSEPVREPAGEEEPIEAVAGTDAPVPVPAVSAEPESPGAAAAVPPAQPREEAEVRPPVQDEIDPELAPIFFVEAQDLFPAISANLRRLAGGADWNEASQAETARALMRELHTLKGSARMAGAMQLGEAVHAMEARIESAVQRGDAPGPLIEDLHGRFDHAVSLFEAAQHAPAQAQASPQIPPPATAVQAVPPQPRTPTPLQAAEPPAAAPAEPRTQSIPAGPAAAPGPAEEKAPAAYLRVRADILDRLVDHAGEISITRTKLETEVGQLRGALGDLADNILRLRTQLREIEVQADAQIQAQSNDAQHAENFDPLEFDRYSRLQELTRQLAESVEDVALVQSGMTRALQLADNDISAQSRLTRDLQQNLLHMRLVPFANVADRLFRVARQAARELGKRVRLDLQGENTEVDRSVLEHMAGPFEHLVRNAIAHGLETPAERAAAGKSDTGELRVSVHRESNEVVVVFADDGKGLDWDRIRARAESAGLLPPGRKPDERELIQFIFAPGFSTAQEVTELAGRGIGMDAVRAQVAGLGGRIAVSSETGRGTRFTLYLPMSLSVMQVMLAGVGDQRYAIPAAMVEEARRISTDELLPAVLRGSIGFEGIGEVVLRPLAQLVGQDPVPPDADQHALALLRLGDDRLAISADDLSTNREVVVKNVGPQTSRLPGILGATVLGDGQVVLILNPVQLIARAPEPPEIAEAFDLDSDVPEAADFAAPQPGGARDDADALYAADDAGNGGAPAPQRSGRGHAAHILVVDDSLTVRRVTQRLLERHGYHTVLAKDGIDALRALETQRPDCILADIEMPRMDGYDLTRAIRANEATRDIPVIMITSRTAEKHRRMAFELGADEYLGKPYREEDLLRAIRQHLDAKVRAS